MQNKTLVVIGIVAFLAIVAGPILYNLVMGKDGVPPELQLPADAKECIEDRLYMRAHHVDILNEWKERVVRTGERTFTARNHRTYPMSLTGTCLKCHADKTGFCDKCHNYAGIRTPYCWDCHNVPQGKNGSAQSGKGGEREIVKSEK
jgi:hypothetical protein